MLQRFDLRAGVFVGLSVLAFGVVQPACSLDVEGSLYGGVEAAGGASTSSGGPGSTSSGSGSSGTSSESSGTTGSTGSGGTGGAGGMGGGDTGGMGGIGGAGGMGGVGGSGGSVGVTCGNGKLDAGEECDDTNTVNGDGCDDCDVVCVMNGTKDPTTHHCYVLVNESVEFNTAKLNCGLIPGHYLASLTAQAEVDFVKDMSPVDIWIGGSKINGSWTWVSNEAWTYVDQMAPWRAGQPSGMGDCVELGSSADNDAGTLNDTDCTYIMPYLCEWNPPGTP